MEEKREKLILHNQIKEQQQHLHSVQKILQTLMTIPELQLQQTFNLFIRKIPIITINPLHHQILLQYLHSMMLYLLTILEYIHITIFRSLRVVRNHQIILLFHHEVNLLVSSQKGIELH